MPERNGLLVDFGGVLTTSVGPSFRAAATALGLERGLVMETFLEAYRDAGGDGPIHRLETGRMTAEEFGSELAAALSARAGTEIVADGLVDRLFAGMALDERMFAAVAGARRVGVRTGLLSNSWGSGGYPRERFAELFDVQVISGEVGLRKPDPAIYALAAERLGVPAGGCVFVDDLEVNVHAAEAAGMHGVLHRSADETIAELAEALGLQPASLGA